MCMCGGGGGGAGRGEGSGRGGLNENCKEHDLSLSLKKFDDLEQTHFSVRQFAG